MISHGIAGFLKERLSDSSDSFRVHECDQVTDYRFVSLIRTRLAWPHSTTQSLRAHNSILRGYGVSEGRDDEHDTDRCIAIPAGIAEGGFIGWDGLDREGRDL